MSFLYPAWLLMLPPLWWLVWQFGRSFRRESTWSRVCDARLLPLLGRHQASSDNRNWLAILLTLILTSGVIALAGPSWQKQDYPLLQSAAARVLILDLSQSMLVEDLKPSRLDHAVDISTQIIRSDFDGETALVVFAGAAFTVSPLTRDASTLLEFIRALSPDSMPVDGDRLDLALERATELLAASITRSGQIIVITDGSSHHKETLAMAKNSSEAGNHISIIVAASSQGAPLKNTEGGLKKNAAGQFIIAKPDFNRLESISQSGRGRLIRADSQVSNIDAMLRQPVYESDLRTEDLEADSLRKPENGGFWLVWLMLPFALLLFRRNSMWLLLIAIIAPVDQPSHALDFEQLWLNSEQRAHRAFHRGDYDQVLELSNNRPLSASALFYQQNYAAAIELFSDHQNAVDLYNLGNTLAYQGKLEEALLAYQQALQQDAEFGDAEYNRNLILDYLQQGANSDGESSTSDDSGGEVDDQQTEDSSRSRSGQFNQTNGLSDRTDEAGAGASRQQGLIELTEAESFSEADIKLEQFLLQMQAEGYVPDAESVQLWTQNLFTDPSELFKRKFLRDHLRNQQQQR